MKWHGLPPSARQLRLRWIATATLLASPAGPAFLGIISGPILLVGHSYGGAVITNAATGKANVKALVHVDAFIPDQGQRLLELATAEPGACVAGDRVLRHGFPYDPTGRRSSWTWRGWTASRSPE
jgi:pimeloyl-ACP methyl ester carboxylesterase